MTWLQLMTSSKLLFKILVWTAVSALRSHAIHECTTMEPMPCSMLASDSQGVGENALRRIHHFGFTLQFIAGADA